LKLTKNFHGDDEAEDFGEQEADENGVLEDEDVVDSL
jgi:hypothetical protein